MSVPPLPTWEGLHALVVHFPIALLLIAPLFVVLGVLTPKGGKWLRVSALILMVLGTAGIYLAVATGESDGELAEKIANVKPVLEQHEELAETTRTVFTALTIAFAAITFVSARFAKGRAAIVNMAFLVFYAGGALWLANTGHQGARLVHELGVRAPIARDAGPESGIQQRLRDDDEHEGRKH